MANSTYTPTITAAHVAPGMVIDFHNYPGFTAADVAVPVTEAEIISVEKSGTSEGYVALWVSPEDGSVSDLYIRVLAGQSLEIVG